MQTLLRTYRNGTRVKIVTGSGFTSTTRLCKLSGVPKPPATLFKRLNNSKTSSQSEKFMWWSNKERSNNNYNDNTNIYFVNPLNAELNPICHLLALLGGATTVVVSRLKVNIT